MTIKINYLELTEEKLTEIKADPKDVIINFYGREHAYQEDLTLIEQITEKFKKARIFFMNMADTLKEELVFVINRFKNVEVLIH
tara:strand:+ start:905 stop:1156 length:252 start_codon:yes stop_codon:yes gene_type:complete